MALPVGPSSLLAVVCTQLCLLGWYSKQLSPVFASVEACPAHFHWSVVLGIAIGALLLGSISTYLYLWVRAATSGALFGLAAGVTVVAVAQSCQTEDDQVIEDNGSDAEAPGLVIQPGSRPAVSGRRSLVVRGLRRGGGTVS